MDLIAVTTVSLWTVPSGVFLPLPDPSLPVGLTRFEQPGSGGVTASGRLC